MITIKTKARKVRPTFKGKVLPHVGAGGEKYVVPCGKCAFCLSNKRSQWMFRLYHEMKWQQHPGWFLTLTYEEKFVKRTAFGLSLRFRDVQLFLKKVRKAKYYAKYVCVGEYGGETKRPHYHMLLWTDCPPERLEAIWKLGRIHFGRITMASAMYTLKYIIQPKVRETDGIEKTRAQFSKGIGISYLTENVYNWHTDDEDNPNFYSYIDGKRLALPRYYRNKIFTKKQQRKVGNTAKWDSIRKKRKWMRELLSQGVKDTRKKIREVRTETNARILKSTKYGTTI